MNDTLITSKEQLNQIKSQARFNIRTVFSERIRGTNYTVEIPNDWFRVYQYNSIQELEEVISSIIEDEDFQLFDCGDGFFFDCNPDDILIIYQIFRIFQEQGRQDLVDKYKEGVIRPIQDYFDARKSGECNIDEMDEFYEDILDDFINSNFPITEDTIV